MVKMLLYGLFGGIALFSAGSAVSSEKSWEESCAELRKYNSGSTSIHIAEVLKSGQSGEIVGRDATCGGPGRAPPITKDVCRVAGYISTSKEKSGVHFEVWLPRPEDWKQRHLIGGNGGLAGCEWENNRGKQR